MRPLLLLFLPLAVITGCAADTEPDPEGPQCPAFSAMTREGNGWRYRYADGQGYSGQAEYRVTAMESDHHGARRLVDVAGFTVARGNERSITSELSVSYICDEHGLFIESQREQLHTDPPITDSPYNTGAAHTDFHTKYFPPLLLLPNELHEGSAWTVTTDVLVGEGGRTRTFDFAARAATITTPAGTFDAIEVTQTLDGFASRFYYTAGEGLVADPENALEQYVP